MRARVAGKTYVCVAMSGALLLAALATSRIELFMLATPLVLVLLPLAFEASAPEPEYTISTELQRDRCFEERQSRGVRDCVGGVQRPTAQPAHHGVRYG